MLNSVIIVLGAKLLCYNVLIIASQVRGGFPEVAEKKVPLGDFQKSTPKKSKEIRLFNLKINRKTIKVTFLPILILIAVVGLVGAGILISYAASAPPLDPAALETVEASYIIDREDREIAQLHAAENRVIIPIDEIPEQLQKAFIAIEDERFEKHSGIDIMGFGRAILVNIRDRSFSQGASTITQQLIRNTILGKEKRIKRKVQEMWLALKLEMKYSKPEILEMYLNRICFGHAVYGVEAAARYYLDKSVGELNLAESALLAGVVRLPAYDNPFDNEEGAVNRMKLVLANMRRLNYINKTEYEEALAAELVFAEPRTFAYPYPYFIDYVVHYELVDILKNMPEFGSVEEAYEAIYNGGFKVYTTLNTDYQSQVEEVLNRADLYPRTIYIDIMKLREAVSANNGQLPSDYPDAYIDEEKGIPQPQSALVLADPKSGELLALGGGREYSKNRNELLRYLSARQPGSAIKPIIAYAPSFEEGLLGAGSALDDAPLIGPQGWRPENYARNFLGMVTARQALSWSYNIPAIRAYTEHIGLEKGAEKAYQMGISTYNPRESTPVPSWAIGSREVTALDMAQAFGVLANNGVKIKVHTVRRIEDRNGKSIYEYQAEPEQVLSPEAAFITTSILQDVVTSTTARGLSGMGRPLAAKTGTTDDARDIYLATYAPNLVATFWMGYDIKDMGKIVNGWNYSSGLMKVVFNEVFKTLPQESFPPPPPGVVRVEVCTKSGLLPTDECRAAGTVKSDYFLKNHVPRLPCDMHVLVDICQVSGLLAGEFCPEDQVTQVPYFNRPEYIITDGGWSGGAGRGPLDAAESPPKEVCNVHTEHAGTFTSFSAALSKNNEVKLTWSYSGGLLKEFELYRQVINGNGNEAQFVATLGSGATTYTDKNVQAGSTYVYTIYAVGEHDLRTGPATSGEITVPDSKSKLGAPKNLQAEDPVKIAEGQYRVKLTWQAADWKFGDPAPTHYKIYRNGSSIAETLLTKTSYEDEKLEHGGTYEYYVTAYSSLTGEESAKSNTVKFTVNDGEPGEETEGRAPGITGWLRNILAACFFRLTVMLQGVH